MVDVITSIDIYAPLEKVSSFVMNPANSPSWYKNIAVAQWVTPAPARVGSEIMFTAHFLGKKLIYTYKIIELTSTRLVMKTSEGPFPMETSYQLQPTGTNGVIMTLRNRGKPSGFSVIFAPFMSMLMRRENRKDLLALKKILEA